MTIQSLVNQALQAGGAMSYVVGRTPEFQDAKKFKSLEKLYDSIFEGTFDTEQDVEVSAAAAMENVPKLKEIRRQQLELNPQKTKKLHPDAARTAYGTYSGAKSRAVQEGQNRLEENTDIQAQQRQTRNALRNAYGGL